MTTRRFNQTGKEAEALAHAASRPEQAADAPVDYDSLPYGDLTAWVGHTVDADTLAELEGECHRRYGGAFVLSAKQGAAGWKVTRFASAGWRA